MGPLWLHLLAAAMRRAELSVPSEAALALLSSAPVVHIAGTTASGRPVLRTLHAVWLDPPDQTDPLDGILAFHAAPAGEKLELLGREAVAGFDEIVAEVPSWLHDPERACPATTFFRSVQLHGRIEPLTDVDLRARALQGLMQRFQPEGGHVPIDPRHPDWDRLYRKAVAGVLIAGLRPERVSGKFKLGQDRPAEQLARVLEGLWRRGRPGVDGAIELCRRAHPERPLPAFLRGPEGVELCARFSDEELPAVTAMLRDQYWNLAWSEARIAASQLGSPVWVGARDHEGRPIASARATTDGAKRATIYDVVVDPRWQGRGVGRAVLELLLDHPQIRGCGIVDLCTRDAMEFYRGLGFVEHPDANTRMAWRPPAQGQ